MVSFPPCGYHLPIISSKSLGLEQPWFGFLIATEHSHNVTQHGEYIRYINIVAEPYTPYTLSLRSSHEPTQWIGSPHIQSEGVVDGDGFPCPRFGSMENLEEPMAAREWTWAGAQGVQLLYLVIVFVLKIWNLLTPNKPMLDLVFENSGHIHLSAPNIIKHDQTAELKVNPLLLDQRDGLLLCWWRNRQEAETKVGSMNPQYLGPAILPLERLAKDHPPGDKRNPIPSMFLPCSWFFS